MIHWLKGFPALYLLFQQIILVQLSGFFILLVVLPTELNSQKVDQFVGILGMLIDFLL